MVDPLSYFSFQPVFQDDVPKVIVCAILSVRWWIQKNQSEIVGHVVTAVRSISRFPSGPLHVRRHITVNKMCSMYI